MERDRKMSNNIIKGKECTATIVPYSDDRDNIFLRIEYRQDGQGRDDSVDMTDRRDITEKAAGVCWVTNGREPTKDEVTLVKEVFSRIAKECGVAKAVKREREMKEDS